MSAQPGEADERAESPPYQPEEPETHWTVNGRPRLSALSWAEDVLSETNSALPAEIGELRLLRDGAKRLAVVTLKDRPPLVLKQYVNDRGAWTHLWMDRLCEAGLAPPARLSVTPARGWSHSHSTLVADMAPDFAWTTWLVESEPKRSAAAGAAADWLVGLQELNVELPDRATYRAADELTRHCVDLGASFPTFARALTDIHHDIRAHLYEGNTPRGIAHVPSHGDLHPNNLHIADDAHLSVTAIDLDIAGMRRPSYDVGYAITQMLIVSWMRTGSMQIGADAAQTFWNRWSRSGAPDAVAVGAESARALLQSLHFELVTHRNERTELLVPWVAVARSMLTNGVPHTLRTLATPKEHAS